MLKFLFFFVLVAFCGAAKGSAKPKTQKPTCAPASVITKAAALKSAGDNAKDMVALMTLAADINNANLVCNGMTFTGTGTTVTDPFDLAQGTYRVKIAADKSLDSYDVAIKYVGAANCAGSISSP